MPAVPEVVVFRDVELLVTQYLRGQSTLGTIQIGIRIPSTRPAEFIRIMRTGGPRETIRSEAAQITVEAWAQSELRASLLLSQCRALLNAADGTIYGVHEISGPVNLPDPVSSQIRYTMSFQVRARGAVTTA